MTSQSPLRVEGAVGMIEKVASCAATVEIPALRHSTFGQLVTLGALAPGEVVERRHSVGEKLDATTIKRTTVTCLTETALRGLGEYVDVTNLLVASFNVHVIARRSFWAYGRVNRIQATALKLGFTGDGTLGIEHAGIPLPFDGHLAEATRSVWSELGVALIYQGYPGGSFGRYIETDMEERVAAKLEELQS